MNCIVDTTLKERHRILGLLERLSREDITLGEMDEIGTKLRKSAGRALPPLVRRLWLEKSGELISKYTYLLDFFEDEGWLQQLIRITLTRTDLEAEGKSALLTALENYGIDVTMPPFSRILEEVGGPLRLTLPRVLEKGEQGLVIFMDDFVQYPTEVQVSLVSEMPTVDDERVVSLLEVLLRYERAEVVEEALTVLGRIRRPEAAALLAAYLGEENDHHGTARRSLRRLSFVGIEAPPAVRIEPPEFSAAFVSPFDGAGHRSVWVSRPRTETLRDLLFLHLDEEDGLVDAIGYGAITDEEITAILEDVKGEEKLLDVSPEYALDLLRDALHRNTEREVPLPPEFYVRWGMFSGVDMKPRPYLPDLSPFEPTRQAIPRLVADSPLLFEEDYCADWFIASARVYDLADEWRLLDRRPESRPDSREARRIIERFCTDILSPEMETMAKRLVFTADLMRRTGARRELVESAVAVAGSLGCGTLPHYVHPFLRRLAVESLEAAAEALAEGYDLREGYEFEE
jgi:hypothetical protein